MDFTLFFLTACSQLFNVAPLSKFLSLDIFKSMLSGVHYWEAEVYLSNASIAGCLIKCGITWHFQYTLSVQYNLQGSDWGMTLH